MRNRTERLEYDKGAAAPAVTSARPNFIDNCFEREGEIETEREEYEFAYGTAAPADSIKGYEKKGVLAPNATFLNCDFGFFEKEMMPVTRRTFLFLDISNTSSNSNCNDGSNIYTKSKNYC